MLKTTNLVYNSNHLVKSNTKATLLQQQISTHQAQSILHAYQNKTKYLQIVKIENVVDFYWEKVVFPYQTVLFYAVKQAKLKIYSSNNATAALTDTIPCSKLKVANTANS
ncbi:DUF1830 domain-containing protein [Pleurocapsales cyanobacterium LEGE 10410]|nr:DUF1830 domain-containing protein [Pleurocapsales cyanobacterium LEGE 10410]